ncbi:hypothetical protein K432DRAFT_386237 [Lepidopterella palustris CBS 459.81]|uniref:Ubiquitin-like domain-containing protein n=1 Tax=Lepidopterella palustris CBS 459.81 TaxID=1314670 RepID=A0A8E2E129_9PEZI|nr:hypothetical protein K432DRAFT_386237 [Lepidopterella palustris CBS 459.81]
MTTLLPDQILYLIIRFTTSIPDLSLDIPSPRTSTTLSLKRLIRTHLPPSHASNRLRLIYAGKVLADTAPLSYSLRLPSPPPPRPISHNATLPPSTRKGKEPVRDLAVELPPASDTSSAPRFYIHCSIGDPLTPHDLAAEASAALASEATLTRQQTSAVTIKPSHGVPSSSGAGRRDSSTTSTPPQGFDRLLTAGFTSTEIASLRSQFLNNISYTHTPDNMPSDTALRALEDRWLDSSAQDGPYTNNATATTAMAEGEAGWGASFGVEEGGLDDMLLGYITGFFWPLAALVWGLREEGVWTRRRQVAVAMGVVLNAAFGFLRWSS